MKEFREVQKVKEKCSSKMEKLLMLQREVEAQEHYKLTKECVALENKTEELEEK